MEIKLEKSENFNELNQEELLEVDGGGIADALPWVSFFKGYVEGYNRSQQGKGLI